MLKFTILVVMIVLSMTDAYMERIYDMNIRLYPCYESASKENSSPICGSNGIWYSNEEMFNCAKKNLGLYEFKQADENVCPVTVTERQELTEEFVKLLRNFKCYQEALDEPRSTVCDNKGIMYPNEKMFTCAIVNLGLYELHTVDCSEDI